MAAYREVQLIEINLLPSEFRQAKMDLSWLSDMRVIWSTFGLIFVVLFLSGVYYFVKETTQELQRSVEQTKQAVERERPLLEKIKELDGKLAGIKQKSDALRSIQVSRKRWVLLFEDLSTALKDTPGTWITGITQEGDKLDISGLTWNFDEVALYMLKLEQKESVTGITLTNISITKVNNEDAYNFSLKVSFNKSLGMEDGIR
ncbi:MAG: PilN domain-containing protein [Fibromonadales bacterium]|nr:PilN domain-containing protein [Fibromonadales bacterium]